MNCLDLNGYSSSVQPLTGPMGVYQKSTGSSIVSVDIVTDMESTNADSGAFRAIGRQFCGNASIRAAEAHGVRMLPAEPNVVWGLEVGSHNNVPEADSVAVFVNSHSGWMPDALKTRAGIRISGDIGYERAIEVYTTGGHIVFNLQLTPSPALGFIGQTTLVGDVNIIGNLNVHGNLTVTT